MSESTEDLLDDLERCERLAVGTAIENKALRIQGHRMQAELQRALAEVAARDRVIAHIRATCLEQEAELRRLRGTA